MYSSENSDNQKLTPSSAPPLPPYGAIPVTGIPESSANQTYSSTVSTDAALIRPPAPVPWSSGLCDCTADVKNCCITCWCPSITFGQVSEIVDRGTSSCIANAAIYVLIKYFTGCYFIYPCYYRSKLRQQYNLKESPCADCLVHCCCTSCALCQEYRELQSRGFDMSKGWNGNVEMQSHGVAMPPIVQQGMTR